nr:telomere repeat-binding factor 1-like isoform X1 [Ipomoea batatas]GMC66291.1 telomere repeat-binding factor 1-like isoform X1 [Ipomoea batatas]GMC67973.1 telomere repeat-binding factor 1-like isoform X1 [Ipomoea batatas]
MEAITKLKEPRGSSRNAISMYIEYCCMVNLCLGALQGTNKLGETVSDKFEGLDRTKKAHKGEASLQDCTEWNVVN